MEGNRQERRGGDEGRRDRERKRVRGRERGVREKGREEKKRGEGLGASVVFTSLKGQWRKTFGPSFSHASNSSIGRPKQGSFEQI